MVQRFITPSIKLAALFIQHLASDQLVLVNHLLTENQYIPNFIETSVITLSQHCLCLLAGQAISMCDITKLYQLQSDQLGCFYCRTSRIVNFL